MKSPTLRVEVWCYEMLYKIDGNLDIKDVSAKYNVIVLLSNNMFYTKGVIDILQDELGYKGVDDINLDGFGIMGSIVDIKKSYSSLNDYISNIATPSLYGRHFYVCDYGGLNANEIKKLHEYNKHSNSNGLLVVTVNEYKNYVRFMGKEYTNNNSVMVLHGYVSKDVLKPILKTYLAKNNISYDNENTLETLMYQVGSKHSIYFDLVSRLDGYGGKLTYEILKNELQDVQNVDVLDLLVLILKNKSSKKLLKKNNIYKTLDLLLGMYKVEDIIKKMRYYINDLIKLRNIINSGKIPLVKNLDIEKVLMSLEDSFKGITAYRMGKYIAILEETSLVELLCVQFILNEVTFSELGNYNKLLGIINRYSIKDSVV